MAGLVANQSVLSDEQYALLSALAQTQSHLFSSWPTAGESDADKVRLAEQLQSLDSNYPGGLAAYISRGRELLAASKEGKNPYEGYNPGVPVGERLTCGTAAFDDAETAGMAVAGKAAFVLVAGGLGERLGYQGIKLALPLETMTGGCFLKAYCDSILALQARARAAGDASATLPLAIMTSGDTHDRTVALLRENENFGLAEGQVTLVKQEKVPALLDGDARFAQSTGDPYGIDTKPHGHGDVHTLLHTSGVARDWAAKGKQWVVFLQDTNGLVFRAIPAALGVSAKHGFRVNSVAVPRKPGEAVGGICRLVKDDGSSLTINVEYNQLDPLLRATTGNGDIADESGFSPYPGNINVLVFDCQAYAKVLDATQGVMPEFVNPKYADSAKIRFKKPTRLECMMQDYPKLLVGDPDAKVGFTQMERFLSFSAVKNNVVDAKAKLEKTGFPESASSGEAAVYDTNRRLLAMVGCDVKTAALETAYFLELPFAQGARVVLGPSFGTTVTEIRSRFPSADKVKISERSTLIVEGNVEIHTLTLDGTLVLKAAPGCKVVIKELHLKNKGWELVALEAGDEVDEKLAIRGYKKKEIESLVIEAPSGTGEVVIDRPEAS